jgi:hypothetical protein
MSFMFLLSKIPLSSNPINLVNPVKKFRQFRHSVFRHPELDEGSDAGPLKKEPGRHAHPK